MGCFMDRRVYLPIGKCCAPHHLVMVEERCGREGKGVPVGEEAKGGWWKWQWVGWKACIAELVMPGVVDPICAVAGTSLCSY